MEQPIEAQGKPVRLSGHARRQLGSRGVTEAEVVGAIETEEWKPAERDRLECRKNFPFNRVWNRVYHGTKQVRPIFVDEPAEIVVVTVYAYYF